METEIQNYLQMASSENADERAEAARELKTFLKDESVCAVLMELSGDADWRVRRAAVESFLEAHEPQTLPRILQALYEEENAGRRNAALDILSRFGKDILPFLPPHLSSDNADVRMFLINILGVMRDPHYIQFLQNSLHDKETNVVSAAIVALGKIGHSGSLPHILRFLHGSDLWLKFQAMEAAGEMQDPAAIPELIALHSLPYCRKPVIKALARFQHPDAFAALLQFVMEEDKFDPDTLQAVIDLYHTPQPSRLKFQEQQAYRQVCAERYGSAEIEKLVRALEISDTVTQKNILEILGWTHSSKAIPSLISSLQNPDLYQTAAQALSDRGSGAIVPLLEFLGQTDNPEQTILVLNILNELPEIPEHRNVDELLSHPSTEIRYHAYKLLRWRDSSSTNDWLTHGVTDAYAPIHELSRETLMDRCANDPALSRRVKSKLFSKIHSLSAEERANAMEFLVLLKDENAPHLLFQALKDEEASVRVKAVRLIGMQSDPEFQRPLMASLADEDAQVRELAARALGNYLCPEVVDALLSSLGDEVLWVRIAIYETLSLSAEERIVETFLHQFDQEGPIARVSLLGAIGKFPHPSTRDKLLSSLNDGDPEMRKTAAEALKNFNDPEIIYRLFSAMQTDPDWRVRAAAIRALVTLSPSSMRDSLLTRFGLDSDPMVRRQILQALQELRLQDLPEQIYDLLLDPGLADPCYEYLSANKEHFQKQIYEASFSHAPAIRHILRSLLN